MTIIVKLSDLSFLPEFWKDADIDGGQAAEMIRKQFGFLAPDVRVSVRDGNAAIEFAEPPAASLLEAERLAHKGSQKAMGGEYTRAVEILRRALCLNPAMPNARRDLAMSLFELGDMEAAKGELLDTLRLQPSDAGSLVVLGNIYFRHEKDPKAAEKFFSRALELKPGDAHALNSLAAVHAQSGRNADALGVFEKAIAAAPDFPNARFGKALLEQKCGLLEAASKTLLGLFRNCTAGDARAQPVFSEARSMFLAVEKRLALQKESDAFKALEKFKAQTAVLSGYPIECREDGGMDASLSGMASMAWKYGRDRHLIKTKPGLPPPDLLHVTAHEITHIFLESRARESGKNRFFSTNEKTIRTGLGGLGNHIAKLAKAGLAPGQAEDFLKRICGFACSTLFNTPLDFEIEWEIHNRIPELRHAQFVSLHRLAEEAIHAVTHSHSLGEIPKKFLEPVVALNAAAALFLDDFSGGATAFWPRYSNFKGVKLAPELFQIWKSRPIPSPPGAEYSLVDQFAGVLGMQGWYQWIPDTGSNPEIHPDSPPEGVSNPALFAEKQPEAQSHLLDALRRFDGMEPGKIREIAFEIGKLGQEGIDYADPRRGYTLRSIPGQSFSGLHLMCLMFAAFKRIAPDLDSGMDLEDPWLEALQIHNSGKKGEA